MKTLIKQHQEQAQSVFYAALHNAEKELMSTPISNNTDAVKVLIEMAEFHLLVHNTIKAEKELAKALSYLNGGTENELKNSYIVYILKSLSGIHECMGRKQEAKEEMKKALILEEKLNNRT